VDCIELTKQKKIEDITKVGNILVAGQTGSGKSVLIKNILSVIYKQNPGAEYIFIDPKRIEFWSISGNIPGSVYADNQIDTLFTLAKLNGRMMEDYNRIRYGQPVNKKYLIIDELQPIIDSPYETKAKLQNLLYLGRAANMQVIAATQYPDRKTLPQEIKSNFEIRIALRCNSPLESKYIIGQNGAEEITTIGYGICKTNRGLNEIEFDYINNNDVIAEYMQSKNL